ncbi:MAG: SapC family protein [Colwellia sp.]|nr:SapC family protein [Colwellia sp.]MCW8864307.1 SapC family protein [Colwellia sp.]MCW9082663.1 SapC family protein [Colwellia sp.]
MSKNRVPLDSNKHKYFAAIYSHLASLSQFKRLLQLKSELEAK